MKTFNPKGLIMKMVKLSLELKKYKEAYKKLKLENEILRSLIQTEQSFEARVWEYITLKD